MCINSALKIVNEIVEGDEMKGGEQTPHTKIVCHMMVCVCVYERDLNNSEFPNCV